MEYGTLSAQTLDALEWPRLLEVVAGHARSGMGREWCRTLPLAPSLEEARLNLRKTAEMVVLRESADPFPSLSFPDLREVLGRGSKGAVLETHELRDLSLVLGLAFDVVRYLGRHRESAPALWETAAPLAELTHLRHLKERIDRCIDVEGNIKESATPELRRLSHHAHDLKQQMRRRLESILASARYADVLQESYFAQREGRYVVPLKADMRSKIPGIVHDVSSSGATVFVEPRELVELNNSIKVAEIEVEREVRRILFELSTTVGEHGAALLIGLDVLAVLDCISAKATFSHQITGQPVSLSSNGRIALKQARHPLLVLTKDAVVPNDLALDESVKVLIISGPNTGGKTVTLKILGLFALMVRAGLQPSCAAGSEMAWCPDIFADIGDTQDLAKDLSSFSAHIMQMIALLDHATKVRPIGDAPSLVLLDEPVTSTDPAEGAALAEALLLRFAHIGMKVVVTTHYNSLKVLAHTTPGFMNASVGFDVETLSPTYRVMMGMPGGSSAIDIAGRLGMDETILDEALQRVQREDRALEQMITGLQDKQRRLDEDTAAIALLRSDAERAAQEAAEVADRLKSTERDEQKRVKKKWTDELLRARAEIHAILENLKQEQKLIKTIHAKSRLGQLDEMISKQFVPSEARIPLERLEAGDRVEIAHLGRSGTLLESPKGKKRVRLRVGDADMSVAASLLVASDERAGQQKAPLAAGASGSRSATLPSHSEESSVVLDLRGMAADEAIDRTVAALDRAALGNCHSLRIIHGHGTGRLKMTLRAYLKDSPYVSSFRPGERAEGGDGVTIVQIK
ncbi:MAG TPA: endonuclease MutS2 [Nitrospiraceae bacterium]|nr:endonuclease MutS2 [Nitrospiraceae bacterium]